MGCVSACVPRILFGLGHTCLPAGCGVGLARDASGLGFARLAAAELSSRSPMAAARPRPNAGAYSALVRLAATAVIVAGCTATVSPSVQPSESVAPIPSEEVAPPAVLDPALAGIAWGLVPTFEDAQAGTEILGLTANVVGELVAVGTEPRGGVIWRSTDASAWTRIPESSLMDGARLNAVTAHGDGFVAVGAAHDRPGAWTSADGLEWTAAEVDDVREAGGVFELIDLASDGERLVAVGMGIWLSDDDGSRWVRVVDPLVEVLGAMSPLNLRFSPVGCVGGYRTVAAGGPGFVALGNRCSDGAPLVLTSADGVSWEPGSEDEALAGATWLDAALIEGEMLAVGQGEGHATVWHSRDGETWARRTASDDEQLAGGVMRAIGWTPSGLIAIGEAPDGVRGAVWMSEDGDFWRRIGSVGSVREAQAMQALVTTADGLVVIGGRRDGRAAIWTSPPVPPTREARPIRTPEPEASGRWEPRAPVPHPGFLTASAGPDARIYVFGGAELTDDGQVKRVIQVYDPVRDTWEVRAGGIGAISEPPSPALMGDLILLVERRDDGIAITRYDTRTNVAGAAGQLMPGSFHSLRAAPGPDNRLLVYAFDVNAEQPRLFAFDSDGQAWTDLAEPPGFVLDMTVTSDGRLFAVVDQQRIHVYDPTADAWSAGARLPITRGDFAMVAGREVLYVVGGFTEGSPDGRVQVYLPAADQWLTGPDLPSPRSYPAAVAGPDGLLYVIGGVDANLEPTDTVEALIPSDS